MTESLTNLNNIIYLTKGYSVIVDEDDYEYLSQFKWQARIKTNHVYAARSKRIGKRSEGKSETFYMHRVLLNAQKGEVVDHINMNTLDNRKSNLRKCSHAENLRNTKGQPKQRKYSKYKGVKKNANCSTWCARITLNGKEIYLGCFKTEIEAAKAYDKAALEYHLEYSNCNTFK